MNELVKVLMENYPNTYKQCRLYLYNLFKQSRESVLKLEAASIETILPYFTAFIESLGIFVSEALLHLTANGHFPSFWHLLKDTIKFCFYRIEINDLNFNNF